MPPFKDEHILIVAPGSQTTLAQLGLPESFTPARLRIPTRMFPAENEGEWEPLKVRERKVARAVKADATPKDGEESVIDAPAADNEGQDDGISYEEDPNTDEDAVYPLQEGRVVNWSCFFALLTHVYNTLGPPFHTPVLLIAQPAWTQQDRETLTQFFFEKFKTPAFALMDGALAVCYAYGAANATVVDVGYKKCDVSAVHDFLVNDIGRGTALAGCGGEAMTQRLLDLLAGQDFTRDMCEQLKQSAICEILPLNASLPTEANGSLPPNPAAAASTGLTTGAVGTAKGLAVPSGLPRGPGIGTEVGDDRDDAKDGADNDGILDIASIVASGKASEFLAKKEREKAEKVAAKRSGEVAARNTRLPNAQRVNATFHYDERRPSDGPDANDEGEPQGEVIEQAAESKIQKTPEHTDGESMDPGFGRRRNKDTAVLVRKEIEVGTERFRAADDGLLERLADAVHRCILSVPEVSKRSELWESIIIVGKGSKIRGFKEALLATLTARYLISPSNSIFTSELPSNISTPMATGANTPMPQSHPQPQLGHHGAGVNPLLLAATTASNPTLAPPGHPALQYQLSQQQQQQQHSGHGQSPTSIKPARMPEYFTEWKDVGTEEAAFLGAQVAAKVVFVVDQGLSKGFMSRTEYNDLGPQGIHEFAI